MLKVLLIALVILWFARMLGRRVPRLEVTVDPPRQDDLRIYAVMREHYPTDYEKYKGGLLSESEERRLYLDCVEILGAREEIERL